MRVIGILGGIASGKSQVTRMLADLGCGVLDADRAGHEVLKQAEVQQTLRDRWGDAVFDENGRVDRQAVARIVFGDRTQKSINTNSTKPNPRETHLPSESNPDAERAFLEQVTHGRIGELLGKQAEEFAATGRVKAIVLDAALLLEAGWDAMCDALVFVAAPRSARLQRALARGWTESEFDAREGAQETLEAKRQRADFEIDNSGDLEHLRGQVEHFWRTFSAANPA